MILGVIVLLSWMAVAAIITTYSGAILLSMVLSGTILEGLTLVFAVCFLLFGAIVSWCFVAMVYNGLKKDRII
tara:strand:- start:782 stop:1000 length:219 start_codon:yes stop_codon:yes gene_type:complete